MVVDLTDVPYLSSAGLAGCVVLSRRAKAAGGQARFCGLASAVREVFDVTGVSLRLDPFATQTDALTGFPAS